MGPKACHDFLGLFLILTTVFGVIGVKRRKKVNFGSGFVISVKRWEAGDIREKRKVEKQGVCFFCYSLY